MTKQALRTAVRAGTRFRRGRFDGRLAVTVPFGVTKKNRGRVRIPIRAPIYWPMPQSKGKERELIHPEAVGRRKKRLEQLLSLALAYRDCTRKELARTLGRDPTKLVPGTGIPKLDVVVELAGVLEWPVGDVVDYLWNHKVSEVSTEGRAAESLRDAVRWRRLGRYIEVVDAATLGLGRSGLTAPSRRALQAILADAYYALWSLVDSPASIRTLARIGMVLRRSTALCTWANVLSSAARSMVSFMVSRDCG